MWLTLFLAFSVSAQEKNEAEQLFQGVEAKLDKAKSLDVSFETLWGEAALRNGQKLKGTLVAMSGNKLRLQVKGGEKNEVVHLRISDGAKAILVVEGNDDKPEPKKTPKNLILKYRTFLARSGVLPALLPPSFGNEKDDFRERLLVSDFKLGNKEKIGDRATQRINYLLRFKGEKTTFPVTLWIDLKTGLPVKRLVLDGALPWFTETYELTLDGKLDPKMFELPR